MSELPIVIVLRNPNLQFVAGLIRERQRLSLISHKRDQPINHHLSSMMLNSARSRGDGEVAVTRSLFC